MQRRSYLRALGASAAVGLAGCLGGDDNPNVALSEPTRENEDVTSEMLPYPAWGQQVPDVTLADPLGGTEVSVRDIDGPHFHTFIFTNCMTVCPVLVSSLREVQIYSLDQGYDDVSFYPVTFDPARDDAQAFQAEADQMNIDMDAGNWHFLRPEDEAEAKSVVQDEFGVFFEKNEPDEEGNYMFTHMGLVLLVNGDGYVERSYRGTQPDEQTLIDDLNALKEA
ncbi:SCO family protein [Haloferax sp. DFSO60]|uniref:SCO family protein n=1 Tax=Haloferax sp. DFSO60 TaxID=3388652 RepID=UPI00397957A5